jgi:uncharacterized protein YggE
MLIVIALLVVLSMTAAAAQDAGGQKGITATGNAVIEAKPDIAYVSLGVVSEAKDAVSASQENARKTTAVIDAIVRSGIPRTDIKTLQYSLSPAVDYTKNPPVTRGYSASNIVRVDVKDLSKIGSLIDVAIKAGANDVQRVLFDIVNKDQYRRQALAQAAKNAQMDAEAIANALGIRLGGVVSATESAEYNPRPIEFGALKAAEVATPIVPGEVEISASATVVYAIMEQPPAAYTPAR